MAVPVQCSYGELGGYPTKSSLNDIARDIDDKNDTLVSRLKRRRRVKKMMKLIAKTVAEQGAHLK